ncbi:MAG: transposase [Sulfobacillus thermosulfidooxidans]|uniref:Transposase n=1 Tax=Sulfobacillus thermosulfidooxidans TaxID=28034 RepID=A0A2T2WM34_SULTH|nr:MAG: transposase [Sulfobacillus thermosulfidooxidans]
MSTIQDIKVMQAQGYSISAIADHLHIDRKTVRKYMQQTDFSVPVPRPVGRPSKLDPYKTTIDAWLEEDHHQWYKQRHTAQRIYDRLVDEFPEWSGSYRTIRRYLQQRRRTAPSTGTLDLVWHPAEAQVDFGQADIFEQGERVRMHFLCVTFPYSNAGYIQLFRGENAECVVQGLVDIFTHIGGAPRRLIFDNASGVGHRVGETVRMTELFRRCQAHYGFETTFCNPAAGYEKGHGENKVGYFRRNLLVPVPVVTDLLATNRALLRDSERHWERPHYQKGQPVITLFGTDRAALRALPPQPFAPYRYTPVRTDRQGRFGLDGPHWYSSSPETADQALIIRVGAHTVEPLAADGHPITCHQRVYGAVRSDSIDYRTTVHRVAQNPGAWRNSALREGLSPKVREALDTAVRADLQAALRGLAQGTDQWGFDHAVRALEEAVAVGRAQTEDILAVARYMALAPSQKAAADVDLRPFDALFDGRRAP